MFISFFISFGLVASTMAQNLVSTYSTDTFPLGTGTIVSLAPMEVNCKSFGGVLKKFQLTRPSEPTLKYIYDCIQAPTSPYLLSTSNQETILNNCHAGSVYYLSGHDVNCEGGLISNFQLKYIPTGPSIQYSYSCSNYGPLSCYIGVTVEQDANAETNQNVIYLDRFTDLQCNAGYALSSFVYSAYYIDEYSWIGDKWRGKYTFKCCRISSMTTLPSIHPTASPTITSTMTPTVMKTNAPSTVQPSVLPTTFSPSPGPTSASPSILPTTDKPSNQPVSPSPTFQTTQVPSSAPTTTHPTVTYMPTSQPTTLDPMQLILGTVTPAGLIAICGFFAIAIIGLCYYIVWKQYQHKVQHHPHCEDDKKATTSDEAYTPSQQYHQISGIPDDHSDIKM
jgi:hypothetical protein